MCESRIARRVWTVMALVGVLIPLGAAGLRAQQQVIDPTWLSFNAAARTARFQLIAGLTGLNGALNFNGSSDGGLTFVVPVGWQTEIDFRNHDGMLRSEEHTSELQSLAYLVCRLLLEKKKKKRKVMLYKEKK